MTELEKKICNELHVAYGVFSGNGTTALYLIFMALEMQEKKVIFPAISCTNPVNAALHAGYQVDFCDVNLEDYTIEVHQLERMLQTGAYGIVVPTHIYGHRYDEHSIRELCEKYHVILLEDAAQSYYVGDMDVAIISFGHTKVCETQMGGGIALTNDRTLYEKIVNVKRYLAAENDSERDFDEYREQYYAIVKGAADWTQRNRKLKALQSEYQDAFIFDLQKNDEIEAKLLHLQNVVAARKEKVRLYQERLDDKYVVKPSVKEDYRWRYTFLYQGDRTFLLEKARSQGIDISSWYYSLVGIYQNRHLKNADMVEEKVVNLWVDETHEIERIKREIGILNTIMEEDHARYQ